MADLWLFRPLYVEQLKMFERTLTKRPDRIKRQRRLGDIAARDEKIRSNVRNSNGWRYATRKGKGEINTSVLSNYRSRSRTLNGFADPLVKVHSILRG